ncbi:hypothetical protein F5H01DRAFT_384136 [Linnemannia elongata]|nr:hypothetical protein F5H01DRAFT_384136 [Linnemannia elongata]
MSQMQRARNQHLFSLESINQPLFLSTDVIEYPQDEGNMLILDHGQHHHHQDHHLFLTPTVISYNNDEEDDLFNLDDQFMALEIASFFADTSGSSSVFADLAGNLYGYYNRCGQHLYCHGYKYYGDEHYDLIGGSINLHDTSTTPP